MNQRITRASAQCIALITHYESFSATAYLCPAKVWTIGWGTTRYPDGKRVQRGDKITRETGKILFANDLRSCELKVDDLTRDSITQYEFDALCSLVHNIGAGGYTTSTVRRLVNWEEDEPDVIQKAFLMWDKITVEVDGRAKKQSAPGLVNRRMSEATLFNTGKLFSYYRGKSIPL